MIGFKPNTLAEVVVLLLFCDGSMGRDGRAEVGAADVAAGGVLSSDTAPVGMPPDGGGTGPNKLFPEREADDFAGTAAAGGLAGGWAAGAFITFVLRAVAAGADAWLVSIAGGFAAGGGVATAGWAGCAGVAGTGAFVAAGWVSKARICSSNAARAAA